MYKMTEFESIKGIQFNFTPEIQAIIEKIASFSHKSNIHTYFVGGMVRDALMGREMGDIDILVENSAIDFVMSLKEALDNDFDPINIYGGENPCRERISLEVKSAHKSFDTIKARMGGIDIDFASTREEDYPYSGCLPVVKNIGCPIEVDLKRRDFTINAMAARLLWVDNAIKYELIDLYGGKEDIKARQLKVLHPKSYNDDPTRVLRGLDFNLRFNFTFSNFDKKLIEEYLKAPDREGLSLDRVKLTLKKLFSLAAQAKEAYKKISSEKYYRIWQDEPQFKTEWADRLYSASEIFNIPASSIFTKAVFGILEEKTPPNGSNYELYCFFKEMDTLEIALLWAIYGYEDARFYFEKLKDIKPDTTGRDLIKAGYKEGKALGDEVRRLFEEQINKIPKNRL